ncbi:interactor of constitutive active ROPs 4-like isoform X2 [Phoenix dactylifera]|uniref:Interactor of constitutive active ROPs 4-like isoform X2 n=1 Tax=Phoenix dactylifera TaxID=42345 RepID=A0A8B7MVA6_PHODC|nr:interactor of constitutive active ROPs 4-like isoform X2 [Phoenix dactylifera]XP_038987542.1 interactor of constitutive active ROPs 4-like isoform X2 [Phoenix dactylifera]XP_038987543.1 interactor of constitutive active ROPs 4-like isoform X2 [Phoenix dactylifera]XP_038987544.1 interactor of constitutive active ROPs 4-like isoform X2 [Phoenix dactylifera]XP_038987545.1 interactor of constitutive active ROPs 4-like isoform X2 [Phoenix dactylifera]
MPSSRGSENSQRQSPRAPLHLKATACSEANGVHRHSVDRSLKVEDRRSPRSSFHEKKRGTRVADLETKFRRAQEELKKLREQLASTEAAKKDAQEALEEAKKRIPAVTTPPQSSDEEKPAIPSKEETETTSSCLDSLEKSERKVEEELPETRSEEESINSTATDVFEVVSPAPVPAEPNNTDNEVGNDDEKAVKEQEEEETEAKNEKDGETEMAATEKNELEEEENKPMEISEIPEVLELKAKLLEKEKELENVLAENESLKKKAEEVSEKVMAAARAQEEELGVKLVSVEEELRESEAKVEKLGEQLEALGEARAALEAEMKRLRVQTEQWRKAAEAAAAVLAAGAGPGAEMMGGRRMAQRCGSLDKHLGAGGGGFAGWGSPLMGGEMDEECIGGGKRRGSGIRMLGDLWKKKGHQK